MELYDPAIKQRTKKMTTRRRRKRAMPAALKRYWANKRRGTSTRRRRRTTRLYDPARRRRVRRVRRRRYDPMRRVRSRRRVSRRRYDPAFGRSGMFGALLRPAAVIIGGFLHNALVSRGLLSNVRSMFGVHTTDAGLALGGVGVISEGMNWKWGELLNHIGAGALSEGMTAPSIEGVVKSGVAGAGAGRSGGQIGDSYIPLGAYATAL